METQSRIKRLTRANGAPPLYKQIAAILREEIHQDYQPDQIVPPQRELAKRFNASYVTIGNALKELVNEGLVRRTVGSGTRVCSLDTPRRGLVGILTSMLDPFYMSHMFGAAEGVLRKARFRPVLFGGSMNYEEEKLAFEEMGHIREVGLIIYSYFHQRFKGEIGRLRRQGIPGVAVLRPIEGLDCVRVDQRLSGALQAQYVADAGFRRILYIGRTGVEFGELQLAGFVAGAKDAGLDIDPEAIATTKSDFGSSAEEDLKAQIVQIINEKAPKLRPEVVVIFGDRYLAVTCNALRELGFEPGNDVTLVGADNQDLPGFRYVSVDHRLSETGKIAAQMLIDRIDKKYDGPPRTATVLPQLVHHGV